MSKKARTQAEEIAAKKKPRKASTGGWRVVEARYQWTCKVREWRNHHGLSLQEVAKPCGISKTCLYQVEHGSDPALSTARKLAAFFGKSVEELWESKK